MINYFKNIKTPKVLGEIELSEFLNRIQNPESNILDTILKARENYNSIDKEQYNIIKTTQLPCYTLNFCYNNYKVDENIKSPTGYIYLDLDNDTNIDLSNALILASWRSLSNEGIGILVKVNNLRIDNFKTTYTSISDALNINPDTAACKPSQFNVQSYDPKLYYNEKAIVWDTNTTIEGIKKNTPISYIYKNREEKDVNVLGVKIRYNNLDDFEFNGNPFIIFEDTKYKYAELYIPNKILMGSRNNTISQIAHQAYALNLNQPIEKFRWFIHMVNRSRCDVPLNGEEVEAIIYKTINKKDIKPILNKERRVLYNSETNLSNKVKHKIRACASAKTKIKKSINKIEKGINEWKPKVDGKISQIRLAKKLGMSKNTINKYYHLFEDKINSLKILSNTHKKNNSSN